MYEESRHGTGKKIAWLTDMQMFKVFKDRVVVDDPQQYCKENDGGDEGDLVRRHPQIPHCARATHYATVVEDWMAESVERVVQQGVNLEAQLAGDSGAMLAQKWVARSQQIVGAAATDANAAAIEDGNVHGGSGPAKREAESPVDTPEAKAAKKEAELLDKFRKQEQDKAARAETNAKIKEQKAAQRQKDKVVQKQRDLEYAKTPQGRAKAWISGLQDHISKAEGEAAKLQRGDTNLPANLANEYMGTWSAFPSLRTPRDSHEFQ